MAGLALAEDQPTCSGVALRCARSSRYCGGLSARRRRGVGGGRRRGVRRRLRRRGGGSERRLLGRRSDRRLPGRRLRIRRMRMGRRGRGLGVPTVLARPVCSLRRRRWAPGCLGRFGGLGALRQARQVGEREAAQDDDHPDNENGPFPKPSRHIEDVPHQLDSTPEGEFLLRRPAGKLFQTKRPKFALTQIEPISAPKVAPGACDAARHGATEPPPRKTGSRPWPFSGRHLISVGPLLLHPSLTADSGLRGRPPRQLTLSARATATGGASTTPFFMPEINELAEPGCRNAATSPRS